MSELPTTVKADHGSHMGTHIDSLVASPKMLSRHGGACCRTSLAEHMVGGCGMRSGRVGRVGKVEGGDVRLASSDR